MIARSLILGLVFFMAGMYYGEHKKNFDVASILLFLSGGFMGGGIYASAVEPSPSAMDVYKGKTSLRIFFEDGVPSDTVVVFKCQGHGKDN